MLLAAAEVAACFLVLAVGCTLSLGIVWYVSNVLPEAKRTLVNRLVAFQCRMGVAASVAMCATVVPPRLSGGLPDPACDSLVFAARVAIWNWFLTTDAILIVRYVFTCRFKNVIACNDDLLYKFVTVLLVGLALYLAALVWFTGLKYTITYYVCTGDEPIFRQPAYPSVTIALGSIFLHILFAVLFRRHRLETTQHQDPANKESLVCLFTNMGGLTFSVSSYLMVVAASKVLEGVDAWPSIYVSFLLSAAIPCVHYAKNPDMGKKVRYKTRGILFRH